MTESLFKSLTSTKLNILKVKLLAFLVTTIFDRWQFFFNKFLQLVQLKNPKNQLLTYSGLKWPCKISHISTPFWLFLAHFWFAKQRLKLLMGTMLFITMSLTTTKNSRFWNSWTDLVRLFEVDVCSVPSFIYIGFHTGRVTCVRLGHFHPLSLLNYWTTLEILNWHNGGYHAKLSICKSTKYWNSSANVVQRFEVGVYNVQQHAILRSRPIISQKLKRGTISTRFSTKEDAVRFRRSHTRKIMKAGF